MKRAKTTEVNAKGIWRKFFSMLHKAKLPYGWMAGSLVIALIASALALKQPEYVAGIVGGNYEMGFVLTMVAVTIAQFASSMASNYIKNVTMGQVSRNMQKMSLKKILSVPVSKVEQGDPREMISRVTTDTTLVSTFLLNLTVSEIPRLYYMITAVIVLYRDYNPKLALSTLCTIPLTVIGALLTGTMIFKRSAIVQGKIAVLTAKLAEKVNNLPLIKSYQTEVMEEEKGDQLLDDLKRAKKKKAWAEQINTTMSTIVAFLPKVCIVLIGAALLVKQEITVAMFIAFYQYASTFCTYVTEHMSLWLVAKNAQGATLRLAEIMEMDEEAIEGVTETVKGDIVFDHVSFSYDDKKILDNVSFSIKNGETTALVGYSGCGKTTVLNLLERFYAPDEGTISIGGRNISDWSVPAYRRHITYISQSAPAVSGTIRDVVTYGCRTKITDEEIYAALKAANAEDFVNKLGGLDYEVGINAERISGGQRQKLSLARAFLSNTDYMLLDEAISALDTASADLAMSGLEKKMAEKTMVIVSHDISKIVHADRIIVFDQGRILAEGTHDELMASCSFYEELYRMQNMEVRTA